MERRALYNNMGKRPRFYSGTRFNRTLKLGFVLSMMLFFLVFNFSDKTSCDRCSFTQGGQAWDAEEFIEIYSDACLYKDSYNPNKEFVYIDIDELNVSVDETGKQVIEYRED